MCQPGREGGLGENECESESRSVVSDSATPWAVAHQAPLSMGLSRQDPWGGLPGLPPGGMRPASLMSPVSAGVFFTTSDPWKAKTRIPVIHVC